MITQRLKIDHVRYSPTEGVQVFVVPQFMDGEKVVGVGGSDMLTTPEAAIIAIGVANGRTDGEWGNTEIEHYVLAQTVIDTPATATEQATTKPRFGDVTTIAWA